MGHFFLTQPTSLQTQPIPSHRTNTWTPQLIRRVVHGLGRPMGWVGLDWVEIVQFLVGWVGFTIAKVQNFEFERIVNAFKARLDKIWLHQAVKFVSCIGLGRIGSKFYHL